MKKLPIFIDIWLLKMLIYITLNATLGGREPTTLCAARPKLKIKLPRRELPTLWMQNEDATDALSQLHDIMSQIIKYNHLKYVILYHSHENNLLMLIYL